MATVTTIPARVHTTSQTFGTSGRLIRRKVAAYARVSTDMEEQQTSYQTQVDYYTSYIQGRNDWQFVGMYTDEGISGVSTKHREGFQTMVTDALAGKIDLILTKSVSRFARNTVDSLTTVRALKEAGVEVYFEKENIWTLDSKGELLITIMSSLAQEESRSISENVKWGHRKRFAEGKASIPFNNLLGYKKGEDGTLVIDETQAPTVRRIYQLFLDGKSINEIKHILESEGHVTSLGNHTWSTTTIRSILRNEKYRGDVLMQKTFTADFLTKKVKRNNGEITQYYVEGHHEPIIPPHVWDQVQVELATRYTSTNGRGGTSKTGLFATRLQCDYCAGWYGQKVWASNTKYKHHVWRCNNKYKHAKHCTSATLRDETIQETFIQALTILACKLGTIPRLTKTVNTVFNTTPLQERLTQVEQTINELNTQFTQLIAHNQTVVQDQDDYTRRFEEVETAYQRALQEKEALQTRISQQQSRRTTILAECTKLLKTKPKRTFEPRQFNALIDYATVKEASITYHFKSGHNIEITL